MKTDDIAEKLVFYCRKSQWEAAQKELYAQDAISIETEPSPAFPKETKGLDAIVEKGRKFDAMIEEMHSITVSAPVVASDAFACTMSMDVTMKGKGRIKMSEVCVYQVKNGKIVSEQFFM